MKNKSTKLAAIVGLIVCAPAFADPLVDGYMSANEYSNSFEAGWYNGHNQAGSQFPKTGNNTTTVYWESTVDNFFLYLEAPLEVKNMVWGTGFTDDELRLYYQHWCSPTDGNSAADDGTNCDHHKDGFDIFKSNKSNYEAMTGSEKVLFGAGPFKTDKEGFEVYGYDKKDKKGDFDGILADLAADASGDFYGNILSFQDSVDWVINNRGCDMINCDASDAPMAFEFMFAAFSDDTINSLIDDIKNNKIEFHLSPERGGVTTVPEPSSIVLLGLGLAALGFSGKKKNA